MRKILLNLAVSLDGYIAGPQGEYDWCLDDDDYGMTDFLSNIDATIMGRKTFEILEQHGDPFPSLTHYVFSKTITETKFSNAKIVSGNLIEYVKELTRQSGKNVWLFGGADVIDQLLKENLVDEFVLSVHPILLGDGIPLFKKQDERRKLVLKDSVKYPSGLVQITYEKVPL